MNWKAWRLLLAALAAGCGEEIAEAGDTGALQVVVETGGASLDPDGFLLRVGALTERVLATTDSVTIADLEPGPMLVTLSGLAPNCSLDGSAGRQVEVLAGPTTRLVLEVTCAQAFGAVRLYALTTGLDLDPDGYELDFQGVRHVALNGELAFYEVPAGSHTLEVRGLSANCHIQEGTRQAIVVAAYSEVRQPVHIRCGYLLIGGYSVGLASLDGAHVIQLTPQATFLYHQVTWARDGTRIAFIMSDRPGIGVMNADGTGITVLTSEYDFEPAWSPDGTQIAFVRNGFTNGIWMMNADGTNQRQLPGSAEFDHSDSPSWSPDGESIAYDCGADWGIGICVMSADGSSRRILHGEGVGGDRYPEWSPDGTRIAFFNRVAVGSTYRLFVMNADGTGVRQLTEGSDHYQDLSARWSLSGEVIFFERLGYPVSTGPGIHMLRPDDDHPVAVAVPVGAYDIGGPQPR